MLAQGGSDMGYAVLNSVHNGGKFAHWKQALNEETTKNGTMEEIQCQYQSNARPI